MRTRNHYNISKTLFSLLLGVSSLFPARAGLFPFFPGSCTKKNSDPACAWRLARGITAVRFKANLLLRFGVRSCRSCKHTKSKTARAPPPAAPARAHVSCAQGRILVLGCPATCVVVRYTQRDRRQRDWALPLGACVKCACGRAKVARGYGNRWTDASAPAALVHTDAKKLTLSEEGTEGGGRG